MPLGNLNLLLRDITAHFDDFHAVEQWAGNGVEVIGRSNEKHFRQVIVNIKIVVVERIVLFGVEHL